MNVKIKKILSLLLCVVAFIYSGRADVYAYQYNGYKLTNPSSVKYLIGTSVRQYSTMLRIYTETWETYCDEITVTNVSSNENIYFYGNVTVDNGTYAVTTHTRDDYHVITFYKAFADTTSAYKYETIVHEVGHALGLAHCEEGKESISVMRALGFNNKAYPLADDISGIANLY